MQSPERRVLAMAMTVDLPALERPDAMTPRVASSRLRRYAGPALGLLLPVGLALIWEVVVARGWSNGRLVPPPTKVFATIRDFRHAAYVIDGAEVLV